MLEFCSSLKSNGRVPADNQPRAKTGGFLSETFVGPVEKREYWKPAMMKWKYRLRIPRSLQFDDQITHLAVALDLDDHWL